MEITGLARLYARALMDYKKLYSKDVVWMRHLDFLARFFDEQRSLLYYTTEEVYQSIFKTFTFDYVEFEALVHLLTQQHRRFLLSDILREMGRLYRAYHGYEFCELRSSQSLTEEQRTFLIQQLEHKIRKQLYYVQKIDPKLIAGVRVQGEHFVWEHSVAQQLRYLKQHLVRT